MRVNGDRQQDNANNGNASGGELLVDGSFEGAGVAAGTWSHFNSVGGWYSDTGVEVWGKGFNTPKGASDGDKLMELDYDGRMSRVWQDVQTGKGTDYTFSFDSAMRQGTSPGTNTIEVYWNGQLVGRVDPSSTDWQHNEFHVVGTGGTDRIEFREVGSQNDSYGGLIDNVSLKASQTPDDDQRGDEGQSGDDGQNGGDGRGDHDRGDHQDGRHEGRGDGEGRGHGGEGSGEHEGDGGHEGGGEHHEDGGQNGGDGRGDDDRGDHEDGRHEGRGDGEGRGHGGEGSGEHQGDGGHEGGGEHHEDGGDHHDDGGHDDGDRDQGGDGDGHHDQDGGGDQDGGNGGGDNGGGDVVSEQLVLVADDVSDVATGDLVIGNRQENDFVGGAGNDRLEGRGGNDNLVGDRVGSVTVPLHIQATLTGGDPNAVSIVISGMPQGATLSAGVQNQDGTWTLGVGDLDQLSITASDQSNFTLTVTASSTDGSELMQVGQINVTLNDGQQDILVGGMGNDTLDGGGGDDVMYGGSQPSGNPSDPAHVSSEADNDVLHGGDGNDVMYGNSGDDQLFGDAGNDWMSGGKGNDEIHGGAGENTLNGDSGDDVIYAEGRHDTVVGGSGNDTIHDGSGDNDVTGGSGDDTVIAGGGNDQFTGGSGFDTLDFSNAAGDSYLNMQSGQTGTSGYWGSSLFTGFEKVIGSNFNDHIIGSNKADVIEGGAGSDGIRGGLGGDTLTGGEGNDVFAWERSDLRVNTQAENLDHITDFSGGDMLDFSMLFVGQNIANAADVVRVSNADDGMHVSVQLGSHWVEVAVLDGVHENPLANGQILV
jgi:Ca2+-binding RTX toxin-like protein